MWRVFESAFVRKLAYLLAALLLASVLGHRALAQTCYVWQGAISFTVTGSASDVCAQLSQQAEAQYTSVQGGGSTQITLVFSGASATASGTGQSGVCADQTNGSTYTASNGYVTHITYGQVNITTVAGSCSPSTCGDTPGNYDIVPPGGIAQSEGSTVCGSDNCSFTMGPTSSFRTWTTGSARTSQSAVNTGLYCNFSSTSSTEQLKQVGSQLDTGTPVSDCQSSSGLVTCVTQDTSGHNCGTYNGDAVCVGVIPPGKCESFSSGGVACTYPAGTASMPTPPGPDTGTAGTAATPSATLSVQTAAGTTTTAYYTSTLAGKSKNPVSTTGSATTGASNGTSASGGATTGTGSTPSSTTACVPSAETQCGDSEGGGQDCSAPPSCSGDAVTCGIVNQTWLQRCAVTSSTDIASAIALNPGEAVASSVLDESSVIGETGYVTGGGTSCPSPPSVTVLGHSMQFDFLSYICQFATLIGPIVLVVAYLMAARIWIGSLTQ